MSLILSGNFDFQSFFFTLIWNIDRLKCYLMIDPKMPCYILQLPDELQLKILGELPVQDLLKSTVVCFNNAIYS